MSVVRRLRHPAAALLLVQLCALPVRAQPAVVPAAEVRQIVTFLFQPGRAADASAIYESQLKPIYTDIVPLQRFRAYREAESPEPLDLVVVSSYRGMAGMDAANAALRTPHRSGKSAFALYGTLSAMTQHHHDQFVEMLPQVGPAPDDSAGITVFEYLRVAEKDHDMFVQLFEHTRRKAVDSGVVRWTEFGRMLVSDGWDFLCISHLRSLGDWQRYRAFMRGQHEGRGELAVVTARKTIILRQDPRLSVR